MAQFIKRAFLSNRLNLEGSMDHRRAFRDIRGIRNHASQ